MWVRSCPTCNEKAEIKRFRALSVRVGVAGPYESRARLQPRKQHAGILRREGRANCGKSNRVLHTDQLPKKREMGVP